MLNKDKIILGIAPIGWSNDADSSLGGDIPFEQCISEMALAGFRGCEIGVKFPRDTEVLKRKLSIRGLQVVNQWTTLRIVENGLDWSEQQLRTNAAFLKEMRAKVIGVADVSFRPATGGNYTPNGHYVMNDEQWKVFCEGLDYLGKIALEEYGLKLCFHHHAGTSVETEEEIARMLDHTDPKYVWLLFDTGHLDVLGFDPTVIEARYVNRIGHVHLKSVRYEVAERCRREETPLRKSIAMNIYTVPGDGDTDFRQVFRILSDANYEGVILVEAEQDPAISNPFEMAVTARNYIREVAGL